MNKQFIINYIKWVKARQFKKSDINSVLEDLISALEKENFACYNCGFTNASGCYETQKICSDVRCVNKVCGFCYDEIEDNYIDDENEICKKGCRYENKK